MTLLVEFVLKRSMIQISVSKCRSGKVGKTVTFEPCFHTLFFLFFEFREKYVKHLAFSYLMNTQEKVGDHVLFLIQISGSEGRRGIRIHNEHTFYLSELTKKAILTYDNTRLTWLMLPLCRAPMKCAEMLWKVMVFAPE